MLEGGTIPTVAEAADTALVGRTTAYRYFPTQNHLLLEAALGDVPDTLDIAASEQGDHDPVAQVDDVLAAMHKRICRHEEAFRAVIRLSLERAFQRAEGQATEVRLLGGKRLAWMTHAVQPLDERLGPARTADLAAALAMLGGTEAFIALKDACEIDGADERSRIIRWAAQALIRGALSEPDDE